MLHDGSVDLELFLFSPNMHVACQGLQRERLVL